MNSLHSKVDEYLALRRALGFHLRREGCSLPQFADWMQRRQTATITAALAIEWARLPIGVHPVTWSHRLSAVRMFARWLAATDPTVEIPPSSVFPGQGKRPDPYIYSDDEIAALLAAAHTILRPALRAATIETMLGLLAVSGVRVGEACRLGRRDIDLATGLLTVVEGKSRSPRILPLHPSTVEALASYAALRDARHPDAVTFFVSLHGTTLTPGAVRNAFLPLTTHTGLRVGNRGPRVHDLRH
jgi:integrase